MLSAGRYSVDSQLWLVLPCVKKKKKELDKAHISKENIKRRERENENKYSEEEQRFWVKTRIVI